MMPTNEAAESGMLPSTGIQTINSLNDTLQPSQQINTDFNTIESIPSTVTNAGGTFTSTPAFKVLVAVLVVIGVTTVIVVPVVVTRTRSTTTTTTILATTTTTFTTTTTAYYSCSNFTVTINWDYPNNDISHNSPTTFPDCCVWCSNTSTCTTFALTNTTSTCWIKTSAGGAGSASSVTISATR